MTLLISPTRLVLLMPYSKEDVGKYLSEIEDLLVNSRKVNGDITSVDKLVEQARQLYEKNEFEEAITYLNEAREKLNEIYVQGAKEQLSFLRGITSAIKNTGIDPKELREYLKNTRVFFENKDYISAYKTALEGMEFATRLIQQDEVLRQKIYKSRQKFGISDGFIEKIEKMDKPDKTAKVEVPEETEKMYLLETKLKLAQNAGIDTAPFKELLENIDKIIAELDEKLTEALNQKMREKLGGFRERIKDFKREGIDTTKLEDSISKFEEKMDEIGFEDAFSELKRIDEEIQHPDLYITALKKKIEILKNLNEDVKDFDAMLGQAELFRTDGNLASASAIAREAFNKIGERIADVLKREIERTEELFSYALTNKLKGIQSDEINGIIELYKEGNYSECAKQLSNLNSKLENIFKEHIKDRISSLNVRMNVARNMGVPLSNVERTLQAVREKIGSKDYLGALTLLGEMEQKCELDMQKYRMLNDLLGDVDKKMQGLLNAGIKSDEIQEMFAKVIELKNKDIDGAIAIAKDTMERINQQLKTMNFGIELEFSNVPEAKGTQTQAEIVIKNTGNIPAKDVKIECSPPITGLKTSIVIVHPNARDTQKVKLNLDTEKIKFKVNAHNPVSGETVVIEREFNLAMKEEKPAVVQPQTVQEPPKEVKKEEPKAVAEKPPEKTFVKKNADAVYQCAFCRGKIKVGLPMVLCECGATYHEPCANRAGKCLKCGKPLK